MNKVGIVHVCSGSIGQCSSSCVPPLTAQPAGAPNPDEAAPTISSTPGKPDQNSTAQTDEVPADIDPSSKETADKGIHTRQNKGLAATNLMERWLFYARQGLVDEVHASSRMLPVWTKSSMSFLLAHSTMNVILITGQVNCLAGCSTMR